LYDGIHKSELLPLTSDIIHEYVVLGSMIQRLLSLVIRDNTSVALKIGTAIAQLLRVCALKRQGLPLTKAPTGTHLPFCTIEKRVSDFYLYFSVGGDVLQRH
jgi:hypothetical protein